ncbi:MAG: 30S ribosomal protein S8 [Candidatus Kerfeldbacteria bacterium CG08_land_8_20_14_0_20_40_16]|uniref:Small ribosomal subunit protein uS8 n=1 Tax=Candidatus Kerfeldbacteria bacterium CG08_land_8_20_14_0_20_40_16 TaxID=2014244 RepID=A0A2H0YUV9_9BACT|nr:MAG: 30S ribosomal protein S8 [Candidatus Kerfeldbacteria bacterium CG08_land_8_20_14_0_20_40_16]
MTMTDPIADMLTRIRNAVQLKKDEVVFPFSKIKFEIAKILTKEGYIKNAQKTENTFAKIKITLKYTSDRKPVIQNLTRVSKPGRKVYVHHQKLPYVLNSLGIAIISTPNGLMTNKEARKNKLGGEVICEVS